VAVLCAVALAVVGLAVSVPSAQAVFATGGTGLYKGSIDWFSWGAAGTNINVGGTATQTNTRVIGGKNLSVTCTISNVANSGLTVIVPNNVSLLSTLYNVGGVSGNTMTIGLLNQNRGGTSSFSFACSAAYDGTPVELAGLVMADAEQMSPAEQTTLTPTGTGAATAPWYLIDRSDLSCGVRATLTTANVLTWTSGCTGNNDPVPVFFAEGVTAADVTVSSPQGLQAIALGVMFEADLGDAPASYGQAGALQKSVWTGGGADPRHV
jgi:hypothetical protein